MVHHCAYCGSTKIKQSVIDNMIVCPKCHTVWYAKEGRTPVREKE